MRTATDTWRTWELVLPAPEREHDVLAPTLAGHAGGPPLPLCVDAQAMIEQARHEGWPVDLDRIACPLRIVWGTEDRLLPWPRAAARFREALWHADWIELDGIGHCPQLDVPIETAQLILDFTAR